MRIKWIVSILLGTTLFLASPAVAAGPDSNRDIGPETIVGRVSEVDRTARTIVFHEHKYHVPARVRGLEKVRRGAIVTLLFEELDGEFVVSRIAQGDEPDIGK